MDAKSAGEAAHACLGMTEERIGLLNDLGFAWTVRGRRGATPSVQKPWLQWYQELKAYQEQNGHCLVPSAKFKGDPKLRTWAKNQHEGKGSRKAYNLVMLGYDQRSH